MQTPKMPDMTFKDMRDHIYRTFTLRASRYPFLTPSTVNVSYLTGREDKCTAVLRCEPRTINGKQRLPWRAAVVDQNNGRLLFQPAWNEAKHLSAGEAIEFLLIAVASLANARMRTLEAQEEIDPQPGFGLVQKARMTAARQDGKGVAREEAKDAMVLVFNAPVAAQVEQQEPRVESEAVEKGSATSVGSRKSITESVEQQEPKRKKARIEAVRIEAANIDSAMVVDLTDAD